MTGASLFFGFILVIPVTVIVLIVLAIIQVINDQTLDNNNKLFWVGLLVLTGLIGLIVYYVIEDKAVLK